MRPDRDPPHPAAARPRESRGPHPAHAGRRRGTVLRGFFATLASLAVLFGGLSLLRTKLRTRGAPFAVEISPRGDHVLVGPVTLAAVGGQPDLRISIDGRELPGPRGSVHLDPRRFPPGMHVVRASREYGGGRTREISTAFLVGPFRPAGEVVPCSVRLAVDRAFLDALVPPLERTMRARLAAIDGLPKVERLSVSLALPASGIDVSLVVDFEKGSKLRALLPLRISRRGSRPLSISQRGRLRVETSGRIETLAAIKAGGIGTGLRNLFRHGYRRAVESAKEDGRQLVRTELQQEVDRYLPQLDARLGAAVPGDLSFSIGSARASLPLVPCGGPEILPGRGVVFRFGTAPAVLPPGSAARAAMRPRLPAAVARANELPPIGALPRGGATIAITEDVLNAAADAAWRSGALDAALGSRAVVGGVNRKLAERSNVRVLRIESGLPPVLRLRSGSILLSVGEVAAALADDEGKRVRMILGGAVSIAPQVDGGRLRLSATNSTAWMSCSSPSPRGERREGCFPELSSQLSGFVASRGKSGLELPARLSAKFGAVELLRARILEGALEADVRIR